MAAGKRFARRWAHNGMIVDEGGEKMSKSLGNTMSLIELLDSYDPERVPPPGAHDPLPASDDGRRVEPGGRRGGSGATRRVRPRVRTRTGLHHPTSSRSTVSASDGRRHGHARRGCGRLRPCQRGEGPDGGSRAWLPRYSRSSRTRSVLPLRSASAEIPPDAVAKAKAAHRARARTGTWPICCVASSRPRVGRSRTARREPPCGDRHTLPDAAAMSGRRPRPRI